MNMSDPLIKPYNPLARFLPPNTPPNVRPPEKAATPTETPTLTTATAPASQGKAPVASPSVANPPSADQTRKAIQAGSIDSEAASFLLAGLQPFLAVNPAQTAQIDKPYGDEAIVSAAQAIQDRLSPENLQHIAQDIVDNKGFYQQFGTVKRDVQKLLEETMAAYRRDGNEGFPAYDCLEKAYQALNTLDVRSGNREAALGQFQEALKPFGESLSGMGRPGITLFDPIEIAEFEALRKIGGALRGFEDTLRTQIAHKNAQGVLDKQMEQGVEKFGFILQRLAQQGQALLSQPARNNVEQSSAYQTFRQNVPSMIPASLGEQMQTTSAQTLPVFQSAQQDVRDALQTMGIETSDHPAVKIFDKLIQRVEKMQAGQWHDLPQLDAEIQGLSEAISEPRLQKHMQRWITLGSQHHQVMQSPEQIAVASPDLRGQAQAIQAARTLAKKQPGFIFAVKDEQGKYQVVRYPASERPKLEAELKQPGSNTVYWAQAKAEGLSEQAKIGVLERSEQSSESSKYIPQADLPAVLLRSVTSLDNNPRYLESMDRISEQVLDYAIQQYGQAFKQMETLTQAAQSQDTDTLMSFADGLVRSARGKSTEALQQLLRYQFGVNIEALKWSPGNQESYNLALWLQHLDKLPDDKYDSALKGFIQGPNFRLLQTAIADRRDDLGQKVQSLKDIQAGADSDSQQEKHKTAMALLRSSPAVRQVVHQRMGFAFPNQFPPLSHEELRSRSQPSSELRSYRSETEFDASPRQLLQRTANPAAFESADAMYYAFGAVEASQGSVGEFLEGLVESILIVPAVANSYKAFRESTYAVSAGIESVDAAAQKERSFTLEMASAAIQIAAMGVKFDASAFTSKLGKAAAEWGPNIVETLIDPTTYEGDLLTNLVVNLAGSAMQKIPGKLADTFGKTPGQAPRLAIHEGGGMYLTNGRHKVDIEDVRLDVETGMLGFRIKETGEWAEIPMTVTDTARQKMKALEDDMNTGRRKIQNTDELPFEPDYDVARQQRDSALRQQKLASFFDGEGLINPAHLELVTSHPDAHAILRHGGRVTDNQLRAAAITGVTPDLRVRASQKQHLKNQELQAQGEPVWADKSHRIPEFSSAFYSDALLIKTDQVIRNQGALDRALVRSGKTRAEIEALGEPFTVLVTPEDVGNLGYPAGRGCERPGGAGKRYQHNPDLLANPDQLPMILDLKSAGGYYAYNPDRNRWETVSLYPERVTD